VTLYSATRVSASSAERRQHERLLLVATVEPGIGEHVVGPQAASPQSRPWHQNNG
jgi:hypothetical protein